MQDFYFEPNNPPSPCVVTLSAQPNLRIGASDVCLNHKAGTSSPLQVVSTLSNLSTNPNLPPRLVSIDLSLRPSTPYCQNIQAFPWLQPLSQLMLSLVEHLSDVVFEQLTCYCCCQSTFPKKVSPCNSKNHHPQSHLLRFRLPIMTNPSTTS